MNMARLPAWNRLFGRFFVAAILAKRSAASNVFGVVLGQWTLRGFRPPPAVAMALVAIGSAVILSLPLGPENLRVLTWGVPAFAVVAGAVSLEPLVAGAAPRWLLALGDASYSIYLSHGFVLPALMLVIGKSLSPGLWAETPTILLCVLVSSIAGWFAFILIESPMLRALRRVRTPLQPDTQ